MATTVNINATDTNNGLRGDFASSGSEDYATEHDAAEASAVLEDLVTGQVKSGVQYILYRAFLYFNTSTLPDDAIIISAKLKLYLRLDYSDDDFNIVIRRNSAGTYPSDPLVTTDFDYTFYTGDGGSINTADIVAGDNYIWLNYIGRNWINKTGTTKIALISSKDINAITPDGREYMYFRDSGHAYRPVLTIEYFVSTGIPVVGDPTFSNTKATYTKATANVSDVGGGYEERGFEYGTSETPTWAVRETGAWGATGSYSLVLPDLLPLTTYYARAFVTNEYGTGYSDWTSFTTTDVPAYGIYEEDNSADINICFYVRRAGGKWSIKHGPYTENQADIEIGKILTEGKGKYQIKFTSDKLTGLSVNIMTKLDIKAR